MNENVSLEGLFSQTGDAACIINGRQEIVFWNEAAVALLGYTREEVVGRPCWDVMAGETSPGTPFCRVECPLQEKLRRSQPIQHRHLQLKHKDDTRIPVNLSTLQLPASESAESPSHVHLWRAVTPATKTGRRLRLHLLGPVLVYRADGSLVDGPLWRRVKTRALLALLVTRGKAGLKRDQIIETLWPDRPYASALRNLNTTVYNLRRSLEPTLQQARESLLVIFRNGSYFVEGPYWLDIDAFSNGLRQAQQEPDPRRAIEAYHATLALYRGDYLADLTETQVWSNSDSFRLQQLYVNGLIALAESHARAEQPDDAIELYETVLRLDRCHEDVSQRLMRLLLDKGQRIEAVKICSRLKASLRSELDVQPSPRTRAFCQRIRNSL